MQVQPKVDTKVVGTSTHAQLNKAKSNVGERDGASIKIDKNGRLQTQRSTVPRHGVNLRDWTVNMFNRERDATVDTFTGVQDALKKLTSKVNTTL